MMPVLHQAHYQNVLSVFAVALIFALQSCAPTTNLEADENAISDGEILALDGVSAYELLLRYEYGVTSGRDVRAVGEALLRYHPDDVKQLYALVVFILELREIGERDLALALRAAKTIHDSQEKREEWVYDIYARALFETGNTVEALRLQEEAANALREDFYYMEPPGPEIRDRLEKYIVAQRAADAKKAQESRSERAPEVVLPVGVLPDIVIGSDNEVSSWVYDVDSRSYILRAIRPMKELFAKSSCRIQMSSMGHRLMVAGPINLSRFNYDEEIDESETKPELLLLDENLIPLARKAFTNVLTSASEGEVAYVCADQHFITLDHELNELSRVFLDCDDAKKDAHDILLHDGTAYLLDNVYEPIYLFRVDTQLQDALRVKRRIEHGGVNAHLEFQWINPDLGRWYVIQEYSVMDGWGQDLLVFNVNRGEREIFTRNLYFSPRSQSDKSLVRGGPEIMAITSLAPTWAVVRTDGSPLCLALVDYGDRDLKFECKMELGTLGSATDIKLQQFGELLVLTSKGDGAVAKLAIFRVIPGLEAVHNQDLSLSTDAQLHDVVALAPVDAN